MDVDRCARHPQYPTDNCGPCETRISRHEDHRSGLWALDDDSHADEDRYERHVSGDIEALESRLAELPADNDWARP